MIMHPEQEQTMERIGGQVREARSRLGLRQDELAFAAGVSTRLVHAIERGKPTVRVDGLIRVLGALGVTLLTSSPDAASDGDGGTAAATSTA